MPSKDEVKIALTAAARSHHEYETTYLKGVRDEQWAGYYAAFIPGRLVDLTIPPSRLAWLLERVSGADWAEAAAELVLNEGSRS